MCLKKLFDRFLGRRPIPDKESSKGDMKYLIACLGNIGAEYDNTRHNIGFKIADRLAKDLECSFTTGRLAQTAEVKYRGKTLLIIKPTTYMNLSGKAVRYHLEKLKIPLENLLVIYDDKDLPLGQLRLRGQGSGGTHNGLNNILDLLQSDRFARLRIGIGNDFPKGMQIDFVLGRFTEEERVALRPAIERSMEIITSFADQGLQRTMNLYNSRK